LVDVSLELILLLTKPKQLCQELSRPQKRILPLSLQEELDVSPCESVANRLGFSLCPSRLCGE
jgi:hypothetical protein